jgi:hypothetical protein
MKFKEDYTGDTQHNHTKDLGGNSPGGALHSPETRIADVLY